MSWTAAAAAAAARRGPECGGMWRPEGGEGWALLGSEWGQGGEGPEREKDPTEFVSRAAWANAKCSPVTAPSVERVIILRRDTRELCCFLLDEAHAVTGLR